MSAPKFLVFDLDGTLALPDGTFRQGDLETLRRLGEQRIPRTVATGRSPHAARKLMWPDFPIDYLIFSCGAGVQDWKTGEILFGTLTYGVATLNICPHLLRPNAFEGRNNFPHRQWMVATDIDAPEKGDVCIHSGCNRERLS